MSKPPNVIVAEANSAVSTLVAALLTRDGFRVTHLLDPSAVAAALTPAVRLVVAGGTGHGVSATAVVADLRARGDRTPVLILTGRECPAALALAATDPSVRILSKPFRAADLAAAAAALLGLV